MATRPVTIIAGRGPAFGQGHAVRCESLHAALAKAGQSADLRFVESYQEAERASWPDDQVFVIDVRDLDPRPLHLRGPVIALDNRTEHRNTLSRSGVLFWDTIPHPEAPLDDTLERCLINPLMGRATAMRKIPRSLVIVPGSLVSTAVVQSFADQLLQRNVFDSIAIAVNDLSRHEWEGKISGARVLAGLDRAAYADLVGGAACVAAYFGMAYLEAWYAGAVPLLAETKSVIHQNLAKYLARAASVPLLPQGDEDTPTNAQMEVWVDIAWEAVNRTDPPWAGRKPSGRGMTLLVEEILRVSRL
ncbi:MAG: hypothetical protein HY042_12390 [Spirochaetia bacterium]|nr:hypothetical protein [Spirochaetia bacterium]